MDLLSRIQVLHRVGRHGNRHGPGSTVENKTKFHIEIDLFQFPNETFIWMLFFFITLCSFVEMEKKMGQYLRLQLYAKSRSWV